MEELGADTEVFGNCKERCPFARNNPEVDGIDECSGQGLRYAEMLRHMPHVRPVCLLVTREVTWDGEVLDVPPNISERAKAVRRVYPEMWNTYFEAEVVTRGAELADYVRGVSTFSMDNPTERPDIEGWRLSVALELKSFLNPLVRHGLTVEEAAEHFYRTNAQKLADQVTDNVIRDQLTGDIVDAD